MSVRFTTNQSQSDINQSRLIRPDEIDLSQSMGAEFKDEAIQLIEFSSNNFKLNPEALEIINSIDDDLIVVAVVGKARTGKSYLMNLLLDNIGKGKGFEVDSKLSSCTKGIWMWGNTKNSLTGSGTKILFIDSEGTSATDRGTRTYDSRIFALIVLISSLFIYNTTSNIDENGIAELSLAAHLSKSITTNANIDKDALLTELSPKFIWVIRDFTLLKTHPETGQEITSKEYLEICLRKKTSKKSNDHNLIRDNIIKYFPDRDCVTLPRPVENESDLQKLNKIPFEKLKSNFKMEFKQLKDKIFKETLPKRFQGKRLNGPTLAKLIIEFVSSINSGEIPNINNSWDSVIQKDVRDYYYKALNKYKEKSSNLKLNVEHWEISKTLYEYKLDSLMIYNKLMRLNSDTFSDPNYLKLFEETKINLINEINKLEEKIIKSNEEKTTAMCKNVVKEEFKEIYNKINNNFYNSRSIKELNKDYDNFLNNYFESDKAKGNNKLNELIAFLIQNEPLIIENMIKNFSKDNEEKLKEYDKNLKENNFTLEDLDSKFKNMEQINETYENRIKNLERDISSQEKDIENYKERLENLEKQLEIEKEREKQLLISYQDEGKNGKIARLNSDPDIDGDSGNKKKKKGNSGCRCLLY